MTRNQSLRITDMEVLLRENERVDDLQRNGYRIIQNPAKFCFGMDAVKRAVFLDQAIDHMSGGISREKRTVDYDKLKIW